MASTIAQAASEQAIKDFRDGTILGSRQTKQLERVPMGHLYNFLTALINTTSRGKEQHMQLLGELEEDSILSMPAWVSSFSLWYARYVDGERNMWNEDIGKDPGEVLQRGLIDLTKRTPNHMRCWAVIYANRMERLVPVIDYLKLEMEIRDIKILMKVWEAQNERPSRSKRTGRDKTRLKALAHRKLGR